MFKRIISWAVACLTGLGLHSKAATKTIKKASICALALVAAGLVSVVPVLHAQPANNDKDDINQARKLVDRMGKEVTINGYVSTSHTKADGRNAGVSAIQKSYEDCVDGLCLDVLNLGLSSPASIGGGWSAGYNVGLWMGPAADQLGTEESSSAGNVEFNEANIDLHMPLGNGLELSVGFSQLEFGVERVNYNQNPFFQRGIAFAIEPTHATGIIGKYDVTQGFSVDLGVANDTTSNNINSNQRNGKNAVILGAEYVNSGGAGVLKGAGVQGNAVLNAHASSTADKRDSYNLQFHVPVVLQGLGATAAYTRVDEGAKDDKIYQAYLGYTLSDDATVNLRYEWGDTEGAAGGTAYTDLKSVTAGVSYSLWDDVMSRVEYMSTSADGKEDDNTLAVNLVYIF